MGRQRRNTVAVMLAVAVMELSACGGTDDAPEPAEGLPAEGLSLFNESVEDGLAGSYRGEQLEVYFEALRQPGHVIGADGKTRDWEIVARFHDETGRTLAVLTEGHAVPKHWQQSSTEALAHHLVMDVVEAADALEAAEIAVELQAERDLLVSIGRDLERSHQLLNELSDPEIEVPAEPQPDAVQEGLGKRSQALTVFRPCSYLQIVELFSKIAFWNSWWNPFRYHHTATKTWYYRSCGNGVETYRAPVSKCNHGTCPGDMRRYTHAMTGWRTFVHEPMSCDEVPYRRYEYSFFSPTGHVCNQDTFFEVGNVLAAYPAGDFTKTNICTNRGYDDHVPVDHKKRPWVGHVGDYMDTYGWRNRSSASGGGSVPPRDCFDTGCPTGRHCCGDVCVPDGAECP